ncbi:MAG TPA: hypothetical protein VNC16_11250 [Solirubrobacterales bacterium]|jgi:hypothetical protein|nr:hypothetical protein [Solirubrobacterales bacterium]
MNTLQVLADQLRGEDTPISSFVVDPAEPPTLGELAASGPDAAEYALVIEAVREGYLLHYEQPRLLAGHDPDLALLAGDYLYALGLDRLAALGDTRPVAILSDLISECARRQAEGNVDSIAALWREAAESISAGSR